jgi:hypothetical protein
VDRAAILAAIIIEEMNDAATVGWHKIVISCIAVERNERKSANRFDGVNQGGGSTASGPLLSGATSCAVARVTAIPG